MEVDNLAIPEVKLAATEEITVVQPPTSLTGESRIASLAGLISSLNQPFLTQRSTVEVVYNLLQLGVPELLQVAGDFHSLNVVIKRPTESEFLTWAGVEGTPEERSEQVGFPILPGGVVEDGLAVSHETAVYGALACLLFAIGRQASESAKASVLDNRPDALIRRFGISEADQILFPGRTAGPTREVMEQIYNSFANYTEVRKAIVRLFLGLQKSKGHLPLYAEIMMTNFNLMRGAGMTHVDAIIKLVRMHPWTLKIPELEPYFHRFTEDLQRFEEVPKAVRPYHRLLVPQSEYLFVSSELRPLIAVAGSFISEVEKTFAGYVYNKTVYQELVDKVKQRAPNYQPTEQLSRLATLLGVHEEPLPKLSPPPAGTTPATV
jgi:hypothetical protein